MISRLPATAVIAINGLMYARPLQALAEACEADNNIFNMNMPLLLFVALVGATVGGKILIAVQKVFAFKLMLLDMNFMARSYICTAGMNAVA